MDSVPQDHLQLQNLGIATSQIISDCLLNPVVVRKILQHFPHPELLKLSFVNKLWNHEARSVMRQRGNLVLRFKCDENHPCRQDVEAIAEDLQHINVVPFAGISIQLITCSSQACQSTTLNPIPDIIIKKLSLRYASIELHWDWWKHKDCLAFLMAKKVLENFSGVLDEFQLLVLAKRDQFVEQLVQDCRFLRLKTLKLTEEDHTADEAYANYLRALVALAPNLQVLYAGAPPNSMLNVMKGRPALPVCTATVCAPFYQISAEAIIGAVKLQALDLLYTTREFDMARFNRIAPVLLRTCCTTTLHELRVDALLAIPLMCYGIPFENVKRLDMHITYWQLEQDAPQLLRNVKHFDFTRIFPSTKALEISGFAIDDHLPDHINAVVEQANAVLREPRPDRAVNIKKLFIFQSLASFGAQFFAEMFPSVEELVVYHFTREEFTFGSDGEICKWVNLKELKIRGHLIRDTYLDGVFCGIFPEEVDELREKGEDFLKSVNIVPVMPSITCFRREKNKRKCNLNLEMIHDGILADLQTFILDDLDTSFGPDDEFILSNVTGLIAFARCPKLTVTLQTRSNVIYEVLRHMEPYARVVLEDRN